MNCVNHIERAGINTCSKCGDWLCAECSVDVENRIICKKCTSYVRAYPVPRRKDGKHVNGLLLFIFAFFPPGVNFMYMGLMKRGLFYICSFFLTTYFATVFSRSHYLPFAFLIPIIYFTSFFDGFRVRRQINSGECVSDGVEDITSFFNDHRIPIIVVFVLMLGMGFISSFSRFAYRFIGHASAVNMSHWRFARETGSPLLTLIIVFVGVYFLTHGCKKKRGKHHKHDHHDLKDY